MRHKSVLIMAGGTGGHVYPALAVAVYLNEKNVRVYWLGTPAGLESRVVPGSGFELITIAVSGLRGKGVLRWLTAPFMVLVTTFRALLIIRRIKPDAVLGMGGFVSGPGGLAAWISRIPLFIHEQNSIPGLTNKLLLPFAKGVMEGFPGTFKPGVNAYTTGNPVRKGLISIPGPDQRLRDRHDNRMHLLVIGGSQGARVLNEILPAAISRFEEDVNISIWHQTGDRNLSEAKKNYSSIKETYRVRIDPFIEDMAEAYAWADIVLCRAGALTVAELCVVGLASILVPYTHSVDNHQTTNARYLSDHGCAVLLPETELEPDRLADLLSEYSSAGDKLLQMARSARQLAMPDATREVGDICMGGMYA